MFWFGSAQADQLVGLYIAGVMIGYFIILGAIDYAIELFKKLWRK